MSEITRNKECLTRRYFFEIIVITIALAASGDKVFANTNCSTSAPDVLVAGYVWSPDNLPKGRSVPYLASVNNHYVLKTNKYLEAYADLGQGKDNQLRLTGAMTLTVVFQLAKQWPMKASLISKWGFMPGDASYELGLTPEQKIYFQISSSGTHDNNFTELLSSQTIAKEKPIILSAVFLPSSRMALYIDGVLSSELTCNIPNHIHNGPSPVRLGQRFEGLLGGVWFHSKALDKTQISEWTKTLVDIIPPDKPYSAWKRLKRHVPTSPPTYLGTTSGMRLYKEIDINPYSGSYVCPGDLDNDGRVDFLLFKNGSSYTVPGRLIAIDHDGRKMWEFGNPSLATHVKAGKAAVGEQGSTPALRGIATVYDIDQDGRSEVISEMWEKDKPMLYILDGATGKVKQRINSPLDISIRQPSSKGNRQPSRSHPVIRIARLHGRGKPPSIILKYGASNDINCHAFALDGELNILWHIAGNKHSMGHIPTVADVDSDGCDEIVLGHMLADQDGKTLWDKGKEFGWHADTTAVAELIPNEGKQILISVCGTGPLYCLTPKGNVLWQKTREQVEHGQAVWTGNFIEDEQGKEVIVLASGHVGHFITFRGSDGTTLARFEHKKTLPSYPDFPAVVNWKSRDVQSLWIPQDM
jgi:outer membrane protein assembly factor BamB